MFDISNISWSRRFVRSSPSAAVARAPELSATSRFPTRRASPVGQAAACLIPNRRQLRSTAARPVGLRPGRMMLTLERNPEWVRGWQAVESGCLFCRGSAALTAFKAEVPGSVAGVDLQGASLQGFAVRGQASTAGQPTGIHPVSAPEDAMRRG